jgi:hypothetical protein
MLVTITFTCSTPGAVLDASCLGQSLHRDFPLESCLQLWGNIRHRLSPPYLPFSGLLRKTYQEFFAKFWGS